MKKIMLGHSTQQTSEQAYHIVDCRSYSRLTKRIPSCAQCDVCANSVS